MLEDYPISTVQALAKASMVNRTYDQISLANAVAVGAIHALESGFGGKTPQALKKYQDSLLGVIRKEKAKDKGVSADATALFGGFTGKAPTEKVHGRRTDKSRGHT